MRESDQSVSNAVTYKLVSEVSTTGVVKDNDDSVSTFRQNIFDKIPPVPRTGNNSDCSSWGQKDV